MGKLTYPQIDMEATGKNITQLRKRAGYTVRELADEFDFTGPQAVYNWQNGQSMPTVDNLIFLARLFDTSIENLICLKDEEHEREAGESRSHCLQKNIFSLFSLF